MKKNNHLATLALVPICFSVSPAVTAQATAGQEEEELVLEVTSPRLVRDLYETPAAVSVVNAPDIREGQQRLQLDESLNTVPGLFFQNRYNFAQNLRLSTRGFGARAPFGIRGIRIQVDGIPYTLPDGQSQIDAIDLDSAQRIEVIRGPASVQYGNAAGGVIDISTALGDELPEGGRLRLDGGSDDYRKAAIRGNGVGWRYQRHSDAFVADIRWPQGAERGGKGAVQRPCRRGIWSPEGV